VKKVYTKAVIAAIAVTMCMTAVAQEKGDKAVGGFGAWHAGSGYGWTHINYAVGGKFRYNILDAVRVESALTIILPGSNYHFTSWDLSLNGHYLLRIAGVMTAYPLAGLGFVDVIHKNDYYSSSLYFNIGSGIDFKLTGQLYINAEVKCTGFNDLNMLKLSAGVVYKF
jgi:opacity protein-like surface antigen